MCSLFNKFLNVWYVITTISCEENVFYPDRMKYQKKKYSGVMDFHASKLHSTSKNLLENIHSRMPDVQDIRWPRNEYEQGFIK